MNFKELVKETFHVVKYIRNEADEKTGCVIVADTPYGVSYGWSICSEKDQFSRDTGKGIAILRALSGKCTLINVPPEYGEKVEEAIEHMTELFNRIKDRQTQEFREDLLVDYRLTVKCTTIQQAESLLSWAKSKGKLWANGTDLLSDLHWKDYEEFTCYVLAEGSMGHEDVYLNPQNDCVVLSYDEALLKEEDR